MKIGNKIKSNWKIKLKSGIVEGLSFSIILYLVDIYTGEHHSVLLLILAGQIICLLWEFTFQPIMNKFTPFGMTNIKPELTENELIEVEGPAGLFHGIENVGGKLFLTNHRIIWTSHKMNIQKGHTEIEYQNIKEIIKRRSAWIIDNGIRIITNDGKKFDFVVNERDLWVVKLHERIQKTAFSSCIN